jgi:plasmid stability protein
MPILTIRNVPDDVYDRLKARALASRRSLNSEAIECLRLALADRGGRDIHGYLARARVVRERLGGYATDREIDEAKRSGRT